MANQRFAGRARFPRAKRRQTQWISPAVQGYVNVASGGATVIANIPHEDPLTYMRTRGFVGIAPQTMAADLAIVGAFGIGVVTAEAFAAGIASIPEPFTDGDWGGWFVWRSFSSLVQVADATGKLYLAAESGFEVDSKAMRKVSNNEVVVIVAESQQGAFKIFDGTRHLVALA